MEAKLIQQAIRMSGNVETICHSRAELQIKLSDGTTALARLERPDAEMLRSLLGSDVVVSGIGSFRPSGEIVMIDVESLALATDTDALFSAATGARTGRAVVDVQVQDHKTGVAAFFGTWPGNESDEELIELARACG